jgi:hypothetical protein
VRQSGAAGAGSYRKLAGAAVALTAAAAVAGWFVASGGQSRPVDLERLFRVETLVALAGLYAGPLSFGNLALLLLWCPLQALGALALFRKSRVDLTALLLVMGIALAGITGFLSATLPYVAYRYALGVFPLTCVVAASALDAFHPQARWRRAVAGVAMAVYGAAGAAFIAQAGPETFGYQDWRSTARFLRRAVKPGDAVAVIPAYGEVALRYYYHASFAAYSTPEQAAAAGGVLPAETAPGATVFFVLHSFANEKPLVERFTGGRRAAAEENRRRLIAALQSRGLTAAEAARFLRVTVLAARRGAPRSP